MLDLLRSQHLRPSLFDKHTQGVVILLAPGLAYPASKDICLLLTFRGFSPNGLLLLILL